MGAKMIPRDLYEQAGMEVPYNGKYSSAATTATNSNSLKEGMRQIFKDIDKQDAVNRYVWGNLPSGITGQLLEEVLYHRGQGAFFYLDTLNKFYFLPYALSAKDGTGLDPYGRFLNITPLPLAGGTVDKDGNAKPWLPGKVFDVAYDVILPEELTIEDLKNKAVLLQDYTPAALTRTCVPRATKQEEIIDVMADTVPLLRTAMVNGVGVVGVKIQSADEDVNIQMANYQVQNAALNGTRYIGLLTKLDMEEMANANGSLDTENYMRALQSLDNLRLSSYGIPNGGVFAKEAHMLQSEQNMAGGAVGLVYQDGLTRRQTFCDIINSIWGLGIYCVESETIIQVDRNMDGAIADHQDQSGSMPGSQMTTPGGNDNDA